MVSTGQKASRLRIGVNKHALTVATHHAALRLAFVTRGRVQGAQLGDVKIIE